MTVGWFSPMPPARTGVADYSAALFTELQKRTQIKIAPIACDVPIYHVGNNQLHGQIYQRALLQPGVVVLHDAVLHHFYLGSFRKNEYIQEFVFNYGEFARKEAESLWLDRPLSAQDPRYFSRPMLRRVVSAASAVVVHNPAAAKAVREHAPLASICEIGHFYEPGAVPSAVRRAAFREQIGASQKNGFVFAIFGYLRESKRLITILKAFNRLHRLQPHTCLVVAGEFVSQDLERSSADLLKQPGICRLPHLSPKDFELAASSVDCCLNLRYPTAGETSGIAIRLMGAGKPVIVTEGEEWDRFPAEALFRIPPGAAEPEALFQAMAALTLRPDLARYMGSLAANHIQRYHSLSAAGTAYWNLLCHNFASRS